MCHPIFLITDYSTWGFPVSSNAVVPNLGPPDVLGLHLPEAFTTTSFGQDFWELKVQEHLEAQGWGPLPHGASWAEVGLDDSEDSAVLRWLDVSSLF